MSHPERIKDGALKPDKKVFPGLLRSMQLGLLIKVAEHLESGVYYPHEYGLTPRATVVHGNDGIQVEVWNNVGEMERHHTTICVGYDDYAPPYISATRQVSLLSEGDDSQPYTYETRFSATRGSDNTLGYIGVANSLRQAFQLQQGAT